jgi:cytochrome P450
MTTPGLVAPPLGQDRGRAILAWLDETRERRPVWQDANKFWNVFRYADVERAAADPATFSSDTTSLNPSMGRLQRATLTRMDPPAHHKLRRLVSQAFTPKRVADLAPALPRSRRGCSTRRRPPTISTWSASSLTRCP